MSRSGSSDKGSWWQEPLIVLMLLLLFSWVRFRTLETIELGGDAIQKWFFVKTWVYERPLDGVRWNHHLTRMGDNVPVFLVQRLFGTSAPVYYVGPMLAFLVTAFCTYVCGKRLGGRFTGVLAAVGVTLFGPMGRAASQMVPSIFSSMYVMLATYCLLRYTSAEPPARARWSIGIALCLFAAYTSHELTLYFIPAVLVIMWVHARAFRELVLVVGVLFGLFLLETAFYALVSDHLSRLHIMMSTHARQGGSPIRDFWGLLERFDSPDFSRDFRRYFFFWPVAAVGLAVLSRDRAAKLLALMPLSFLFLTTFLVRGIDPIRVWISFQSRYLVPAVPLITLTIALFFVALARFAASAVSVALGRLRRAGPIAALSSTIEARGGGGLPRALGVTKRLLASDVLWSVVLIAWAASRYSWAGSVSALLEKSPITAALRTQAAITDAYERRLPIVGVKKSVTLAYYVYVEERALVEEGRLPPLSSKLGRYDRRNLLLSAEPARYEQDARRKRAGKAGGKGCVMSLRRNGMRFMRPVRSPLPARCKVGVDAS